MTEKNEFFEGLRDALEEGIDALHDGEVLAVREVCRKEIIR